MTSPAIWSPQRSRVFFMHIPKTAGMALRLFLGNQYPISQIMPATNWGDLLSLEHDELTQYHLFQGHFSCGFLDLLPQEVKRIVFLREPVARTVSHLKHLRRDPNFHPAHRLAVGRSLDELVRDELIMKLCSNIQVALLSNDIPAETILAGLRSDIASGRPPNTDAYAVTPDLAKAERMLDRFQYVGFVESLQQDVLQMSLALRLHPPTFLPKRNDDPEGETDLSELAPDTLALLRESNALDIAFYEAARCRPRLSWEAVGAALLDPAAYAPISQPIEFPMSGAVPGSNWYHCETDASGEFRWTGPLNDTTLDLPLAPGYEFELSMTILISDLNDLGVNASGIVLPIRRDWSDGRRHRISFWIPAEAVRSVGLTPLWLRTEAAFRGSDGDTRRLCFMVSELRIERVERAAQIAGWSVLMPLDEEAVAGSSSGPTIETVRVPAPTFVMRTNGLPLDVQSKVVVLGEPEGFFPDGWVRARAVFRCRALGRITSISLELWAPRGDEPITLTLRSPGEPGTALTLSREVVSEVRYPFRAIPGEEFVLELVASEEQQLSAADRRRASYVLRRISFGLTDDGVRGRRHRTRVPKE